MNEQSLKVLDKLHSDHLTGGPNSGSLHLPKTWRSLLTLSLRSIPFCMMMVVAVLPVLFLYMWIDRTSLQKEIDYVDENHLIIAQNLSEALSRYAIDATATFEHALRNAERDLDNDDFVQILKNFHLLGILTLDARDNIISAILGRDEDMPPLPDPEVLSYLRAFAAEADGRAVVSGIRFYQGTPHFFIVKQLDGGRVAVAPFAPDYVIRLQKSIAFGELGHSMVVDRDGLVVAHPNAEWQRVSQDASRLSVVQAMLARTTGVAQFYSPPMQAQMIAGYTFVPETGWGVMVPQPIRELEVRAHAVQSAALTIALVTTVLAAMISFWFSRLLTAPILAVSRAAERMTNQDTAQHVETLPSFTPREIRVMAQSFNTMVDELAAKADTLEAALEQSRQISTERAELLIASQKANVAKSQFISIVSHELRTPLTSIKGAMALISGGKVGEIPEDAAALVRIAAKNTDQLSHIIEDLLDVEKLEAGKMRYRFEQAEIGELIAEAVEANRNLGEPRQISLNYHGPAEKGMVMADKSRLTQVISNLLSNAMKFSHPGGQIDVTVRLEGRMAKIIVQDYGAGIPAAAQDTIFQEFVQVDSSDRRNVNGTGLGLFIVRRILESHGGAISFVSTEGEGATFTILMPLTVR